MKRAVEDKGKAPLNRTKVWNRISLGSAILAVLILVRYSFVSYTVEVDSSGQVVRDFQQWFSFEPVSEGYFNALLYIFFALIAFSMAAVIINHLGFVVGVVTAILFVPLMMLIITMILSPLIDIDQSADFDKMTQAEYGNVQKSEVRKHMAIFDDDEPVEAVISDINKSNEKSAKNAQTSPYDLDSQEENSTDNELTTYWQIVEIEGKSHLVGADRLNDLDDIRDYGVITPNQVQRLVKATDS